MTAHTKSRRQPLRGAACSHIERAGTHRACARRIGKSDGARRNAVSGPRRRIYSHRLRLDRERSAEWIACSVGENASGCVGVEKISSKQRQIARFGRDIHGYRIRAAGSENTIAPVARAHVILASG